MNEKNVFHQATLLGLYEYNAYANRLVLDTIDTLTDEAFTRQSSPSHDSVQQLLAHMLECEAFFLARCKGETFNNADLSARDTTRRCWEQIERDQRDFLDKLDEAGLLRDVQLEIREQQLVFPVWQLMLQAVIHSTHHRGELAIVLSEMGYPLPTLDILLHFIQQSGQTWPTLQ